MGSWFAPYEIVAATPDHVREMVRRLRDDDRREIQALGMCPLRAIRQSYRNSVLRSAAIVEGEIGAIWGLGGSIMGDVGHPWMLTAAPIERVIVPFAREARKIVRSYLDIFPSLHAWVDARYGKALAFQRLIGFDLGEPEPLGPEGLPFVPITMRRP